MLYSKAATISFHGEAEAAVVSGPVAVHSNEISVSGGGYVTLGASVTPVPTGCGSGGVCTLTDIQSHATAADCRSAINIDGTTKAYAIPESWLLIHRDNYKTISTKLCGKVFGNDLHAAVGEHRDGTTYDSKQMIDWISNFYIGPYQ